MVGEGSPGAQNGNGEKEASYTLVPKIEGTPGQVSEALKGMLDEEIAKSGTTRDKHVDSGEAVPFAGVETPKVEKPGEDLGAYAADFKNNVDLVKPENNPTESDEKKAETTTLADFKKELAGKITEEKAKAKDREIKKAGGWGYAVEGADKVAKEKDEKEKKAIHKERRDVKHHEKTRAREHQAVTEEGKKSLEEGVVPPHGDVLPLVSKQEGASIIRDWTNKVEDEEIDAGPRMPNKTFSPVGNHEKEAVLGQWEEKAKNLEMPNKTFSPASDSEKEAVLGQWEEKAKNLDTVSTDIKYHSQEPTTPAERDRLAQKWDKKPMPPRPLPPTADEQLAKEGKLGSQPAEKKSWLRKMLGF